MMPRWRAGGCSCRPWLALVERAAQWLLLTHLRLIMKNGKVYKKHLVKPGRVRIGLKTRHKALS